MQFMSSLMRATHTSFSPTAQPPQALKPQGVLPLTQHATCPAMIALFLQSRVGDYAGEQLIRLLVSYPYPCPTTLLSPPPTHSLTCRPSIKTLGYQIGKVQQLPSPFRIHLFPSQSHNRPSNFDPLSLSRPLDGRRSKVAYSTGWEDGDAAPSHPHQHAREA